MPIRSRQPDSAGQRLQPTDNVLKMSLLSKIIDALQRPAYVLIFGLCLLFVLFGGVSTFYGLSEDHDRTLRLVLGFLSFFLALASGFAVIHRLEPPGSDSTLSTSLREEKLVCEKLVYIKVLHLSKMQNGRPPIYSRRVERLDKEVPVYDELVFYVLHVFSEPQDTLTFTFRSSGVTDPRAVHPWAGKLEFSDKDSKFIHNMVQANVNKSCRAYALVSHHVNGLQPGHEDVAARMDQDTAFGRLVLDFSSIPGAASLFKVRPKAYLYGRDSSEPLGIEEYCPEVFSVARNNLKEGEVLSIEFSLDWSKL